MYVLIQFDNAAAVFNRRHRLGQEHLSGLREETELRITHQVSPDEMSQFELSPVVRKTEACIEVARDQALKLESVTAL